MVFAILKEAFEKEETHLKRLSARLRVTYTPRDAALLSVSTKKT
jgi:hypothetical protein